MTAASSYFPLSPFSVAHPPPTSPLKKQQTPVPSWTPPICLTETSSDLLTGRRSSMWVAVEVGSLNRGAPDPFTSWRLENSACESDDKVINVEKGLFSPESMNQCSDQEASCPWTGNHNPTTTHLGNYLSGNRLMDHHPEIRTSACVGKAETGRKSRSPWHIPPKTPLVPLTDHEKPGFIFRRQPTSLNISKRQRARSDVDGLYTAAISCKTRLLRLRPVPSRLSRPFSLPATHCINHEVPVLCSRSSAKSTAVATSSNIGKKGQVHREGSIMLRAAVLNRIRLRIRNEAALRGDLSVVAEAVVLRQSQELSTEARSSVHSCALSEQRQPTIPASIVPMRSKSSLSTPSLVSHVPAPSRTSQSPRMLCESPLPRPTRSTVPGPSGTPVEEMDDEELLAFPQADHHCFYACADDDRPEDVYSDFDAIFGGRAQDEEGVDDGQPDEEYLDSFDGGS